MDVIQDRPLPPLPLPASPVPNDNVGFDWSLESIPMPREPLFVDLVRLASSRSPETLSSEAASTSTDTSAELTASDIVVQYDDMTEINLPGIQCACVEVLERIKKSPRRLQRAEQDKQLSNAIHDLLEASYELETFHPSSAISSPVTPPDDPIQVTSPYLRLIHVLEAVQRAAAQRGPRSEPTASEVDLLHPAVHAVREDLAWARVESLSHAVVQLVQRRRNSPRASKALPARTPPPQTPLPAPPTPGTAHSVRSVSGGSASSVRSFPSPYRDPKSSFSSSASTLVREATESKAGGATERPLPTDTVASVIERLHRIAPHLELEGRWQRAMDSKELDDLISRVHRLDVDQRADWSVRRQEKRRQVLQDALAQTNAQLGKGPSDCPNDNIARANELRERDAFLRGLIELAKTQTNSTTTNSPAASSVSLASEERSTEHRKSQRKHSKHSPRASIDQVVSSSSCQSSPVPPFTPRLTSRSLPSTRDNRKSVQSVAPSIAPRRRPAPVCNDDDDLFDQLFAATTSTRLQNQEVPRTPRAPRVASYAPRSPPKPPAGKSDFVDLILDSQSISRFRNQEISSPSITVTPAASPVSPPASPSRSAFSFKRREKKESALRRIASRPGGLLRTMSSGKPNANSIGYICEHQENLCTTLCIVYGATDVGFELDVDNPSDATLILENDPEFKLSVGLPSPVPLGQKIPLAVTNNHMEARIAALPGPTPSLAYNSAITHALSAPSLRSLHPQSLCCNNCQRELATFPLDIQFKDLPSEHWAEMLEVWMCHSDPAFTAQISQKARDGFWPNDNTVLVGGSYLLVSPDHVNGIVQTSEDDQWHIGSCQCGEEIGKVRTHDGKPGGGTVRFAKWAVTVHGRDAGSVRYPVSNFIVSDMLELVQAHGSHRFVIEDSTHKARLIVWVFNPSVRISFRRPASVEKHAGGKSHKLGSTLAAPQGRTLRAAKIMYKVGDNTENAGQCERLTYPSDVCDALIAALQASTALYPEQRRSMGEWEMGFLERI